MYGLTSRAHSLWPNTLLSLDTVVRGMILLLFGVPDFADALRQALLPPRINGGEMGGGSTGWDKDKEGELGLVCEMKKLNK